VVAGRLNAGGADNERGRGGGAATGVARCTRVTGSADGRADPIVTTSTPCPGTPAGGAAGRTTALGWPVGRVQTAGATRFDGLGFGVAVGRTNRCTFSSGLTRYDGTPGTEPIPSAHTGRATGCGCEASRRATGNRADPGMGSATAAPIAGADARDAREAPTVERADTEARWASTVGVTDVANNGACRAPTGGATDGA
jgi:hypothetical protein